MFKAKEKFSKLIVLTLLISVLLPTKAFAANEMQISVVGPDSDGITSIGICFTNPSELVGVSASFNSAYLGSGSMLIHSGTPSCPSFAGVSVGQRLTSGQTYTFEATGTAGGRSFSASKTYTAPGEDPAVVAARKVREEQDADFRARQNAAQATAEAESRAWNAANPGKQKCVQWGPIVHANGVSTASGGVCANPVEPGPNTTVQSQAAESVVGPTSTSTSSSSSSSSSDTNTSTVSTSSSTSSTSTSTSSSSSTSSAPTGSTVNPNVPGSGAPFTRVLSGQLSTSECPVGFQGANGIIVAIGIGTFTECWPKNAWDAYRLGGTYWELYKSSGGTYDIQAVITRLAEIANYKAQAKVIAQRAADLTPGIQRCSSWSAYGESGQECAYTFVAPTTSTSTNTSSTSDSTTVTSVVNADSRTVTSSSSPTTSTSTSTLSGVSDSSTVTETPTVTTSQALSLAAPITSTTSQSTAVTLQVVSVAGTTSEIKQLVEKIEPSKKDVSAISDLMKRLESTKVVTRTQKQVSLPKASSVEESAKSLSPDVCTVSGMTVNSIKKGICSIEYTVLDSLGNTYKTTKTLEFKK